MQKKRPRRLKHRGRCEGWIGLQSVRSAQRAGRVRVHSRGGIGTTAGAFHIGVDSTFDVGGRAARDIGQTDSRTGSLFVFQRPLLDRTLDLFQVGDAGIGLSGGASLHKVRNRDCGEQTDDRNHNHDFNQRETLLLSLLNVDLHVFSSCRCVLSEPDGGLGDEF